MFKKIIVGVLCIMMVFSLIGCKSKDEIELDMVSLLIKAEFQQEFEEEVFTKEDFGWDNIDRIVYGTWHTNTPQSASFGGITIYLIEHGNKEVLDAIEHFKTLNFVSDAYVIGVPHTF